MTGRKGHRDDQGKLSAERLDVVLRRLNDLPTLPAVMTHLLTLDNDAALTDLITADLALTARMLHLSDASTARQAVAALGPAVVRSATVATSVFPDDTDTIDLHGFWVHCIAVASAAELLAEHLGDETAKPKIAFTAGLLHDIGKLALERSFPKSYRRALQAAETHAGSLLEYEREILGVDHALAGRRLAELWGFPKPLTHAIWLHHQPQVALPADLPGRTLTGLVALADAMVRQQRFGASGNFAMTPTPEQLAEPLGLTGVDMQDVVKRLPAHIADHTARLGLQQVSSESLYRQAIASANAELGRMNEQLTRRADQLETQAAAFERLRDFTAGLKTDASVADVLLEAARAIAVACNRPATPRRPVIAYSLSDGATEALTVQISGHDVRWSTLPAAAGFDATVASPSAAPATDAMARVLTDTSELNDWLNLADYVHYPLRCAGRWVGGVLVTAGKYAPNRPDRSATTAEALAGVMAMALSIAQARAAAVAMSEQLAGAAQMLTATQDALAEAKSLSAVGEMAAGAAHEMNNPLAVISGRAQLMLRRAATDDDKKTWQTVVEQAQRLTDLITSLMAFAAPPSPKRRTTDVADLLNHAKNAFAESDHPQAADIQIDVDIADDLPAARVDPNQLCATLVELLINAATAGGRNVHIRMEATADMLRPAVLVTVADDGPGMDTPTLQRAWMPFYSAQKAGRRPGMGLSMAKRTVETNGGKLWIRTRPGEGTTVYLQLPADVE